MGGWALDGFELQVVDVGLNTFRTLLKSGKSYAGDMPFDPRTRTLYYSRGSIRALQIDSKEERVILEPPAVALPQEVEEEEVEEEEDEEDDGEEAKEDRAPYFGFFTRLSPDGRELVALVCYPPRTFRLVRFDIESGAVVHRPLSGFGFLDLNFASRRFFQGFTAEGPMLTTIEGERIAVLSGFKGSHFDGTLSPTGDRVLLWERPLAKVPFAVWHPERGSYRELKDFGNHPTWSPDGKSFWFMKGNHELWRYDLASETSEPIIQMKGKVWGEGSTRAWYIQPVLSPDGRFMYAQLTDMTDWTHVACVLDLKERIVRQFRGNHHHHVTWLGCALTF